MRQLPSLHSLSKKVVQEAEYKLVQLQVSLANALHREKREKWVENCPIFRWGYVPYVFADHVTIPYFLHPKFDQEHQQVEFRTLDCTHILTNIKTHILTREYNFCKKEHFQELATERPDILSRPLIISTSKMPLASCKCFWNQWRNSSGEKGTVSRQASYYSSENGSPHVTNEVFVQISM